MQLFLLLLDVIERLVFAHFLKFKLLLTKYNFNQSTKIFYKKLKMLFILLNAVKLPELF